MSLHDIPLDRISQADLEALIAAAVPESPIIDYKRDPYGNSDSDKREFLADISAFANTLGGDIVIGMEEVGGLPMAITPLTADADADTRRLESIALSGLEPRIGNFRIRSVPVDGGYVMVVRVPRSFAPPHRVIAQNTNRFYARAGTQKYEPNVVQLRHLFNDAPAMIERIRAFQVDRLVKISAGETPVPLAPLGKVVVHVVPLPSFADGRMADIVSEVRRGTHLPVPLDELGYLNRDGVNLDGFINYADAPANTRRSYAQFFRNGAIEGVGELRSDDDVTSRFIMSDFTSLIVSRVRQYLDVVEAYNQGLPVFVFLSLCNATRVVYRYADPSGMGYYESGPVKREIIAAPEIYIDDFRADVIDAMRPAFTAIWNAYGFQSCDRYANVETWKAGNPYALRWR